MEQPTIQQKRSRGASAYKQTGLNKKITVYGRRPAPTSVGESSRPPSLLKVKPMRLSKSKMMELSERDRARDALLTKNKLSQQQQENLRLLQEHVNADEDYDVDMPAMYNNADNDWVDVDEQAKRDRDAAQELEVIEELGVPVGTSEWANRISGEHSTWREQIEVLCDAFLEYRSSQDGFSGDKRDETTATGQAITLQCISLKGQSEISFPFDLERCAQPLLLHGFLPSTPARPTVAFQLDILELADCLQQRSPSTSIQGIAEALCDLRNVPYKRYHRVQLSSALDVYRMICREAKKRLDRMLSHDCHGRQPKNCCAFCTYKLKGEVELKFAMLVTGDGNNSLKRCSRAATADKRQYESEYYINQSEVDAFKNEVASSQRNTNEQSECERQWKNASADKKSDKLSKTFFHETGIFTSTCWHSFVLTICDMVKSGERAKYGLATIDRLLSMFGPRLLMGYDIGCTFKGTVKRSQMLGPKATELQFDIIHLFIESWNNNMYEGLANFPKGRLLRAKYVSALKDIESATNVLSQLSNTVNDYCTFFAEEKEYLLVLAKQELPQDLFMINYVELLELLSSKQEEFDKLNAIELDPDKQKASLHRSAIFTSHEQQRRTALDQLINVQNAVRTIETERKIVRWTPECPQWIEAQKLRKARHFHACIDNLEQLVVQRVIELSRTGLARTGVKLRAHIMKSLTSRSTAVRSALDRYNRAAAECDPPATKYTWEQISNAKILSDTHILHGSRRGILEKSWAQPENRHCVEQSHWLLRVQEEIERLNIEIRRLWTAIVDEGVTLAKLLKDDGSRLAGDKWLLQHYAKRRLMVNAMLLRDLDSIRGLDGYTGWHTIGIHVSQPSRDTSDDMEIEPVDPMIPEALEARGSHASMEDEIDDLQVGDDIIDQFDKWQIALDNTEDLPV